MKAYSASCDKNKYVIAEVLHRYLVENNQARSTETVSQAETILEIGSGTGQHAVFFAEQLPNHLWQPSDRAVHLADIESWRSDAELTNCLQSILLDLERPWPAINADHIFTANTVHIIRWGLVVRLLSGVANNLNKGGYFFVYGPFNYAGQFTSDSNAAFDVWLKQRDPDSGIRDFEKIESIACAGQLMSLVEDVMMPANNRMLVFQKN